MAGNDPDDRRRAERIPINAEFAAMPSATYISDLSELGVFVHTPDPAPMGSTITLRFTVLLDDPVIVEGEGRVVRLQPAPNGGMGIEFTNLTPETILRINDVVSRQRPRDSGPPIARESEPSPEDSDSESAQTLLRGKTFRPPPIPGGKSDDLDNAKTGLFPSLGDITAAEDSE